MIGHFASGKDRDRLGFQETVKSHFRFLETDFDFCLVRNEVTFMRYESPVTFVNVFHGRGSFEIGIEIGRSGNPDVYFRLPDIIAATSPGQPQQAWFQASTPEGVQASIRQLAGLAHAHCAKLFSGDSLAFEAVERVAKENSRVITHRAQFGAIVDEGDRAWEKKDWRKALDRYRAAEEALDEIRRRRLRYLVRHVRT